MPEASDKLCFVQPSCDYQIKAHRHALALTFPYLIALLSPGDRFDLRLYVEDKTPELFEDFLQREQPRYVFLTANTATFPNAVKLAVTAKRYGCFVVLGGIFASMNAQTVSCHYPQFDRVVTGFPTELPLDESIPEKIVTGKTSYEIDFPISSVLNSPLFSCYQGDPVCYEITFGCQYNCSFCTLRRIWSGRSVCSRRSREVIENDLNRLRKWRRLKIIDDDVLQSRQLLAECECGSMFEQIVAETRIDRVNEESIAVLKRFGVTHLIMGVESFDPRNLLASSKRAGENWEKKAFQAIELCRKYGITARPVLQILFPDMDKNYLRSIRSSISDWRSENGIELFFSFFTPHPGLPLNQGIRQNLLTNDLSRFDHLTPVYKPDGYDVKDVYRTLDEYNALVELTRSVEYNPFVHTLQERVDEYDIFFP